MYEAAITSVGIGDFQLPRMLLPLPILAAMVRSQSRDTPFINLVYSVGKDNA